MIEPIRVLIADDHVLFRDGLRALLGAAPDAELVGEAADGETALRLAEQTQPDLVLMDLQMPGLGGINATRRIVEASPHINVLIVTMFEDDQSVMAAMRAGARGYLLKGAGHSEMLNAIRTVGRGAAMFSPAIAARLISYFGSMAPPAPQTVFPQLSDREREVLTLIAHGASNADIAARLVLSPKTVRNHITNILSKLQAADRTEAILRARDAGL